SFGGEAVTDVGFHRKRILGAAEKEREGMMLLFDGEAVVGWLWMAPRTNSVSGERYMSFKSFALGGGDLGPKGGADGAAAGDALMEAGMAYCKKQGTARVIGKVHSENLAMRAVYKRHGFKPTHVTMELEV
ncbi:MAG: GNAT family N-acetyltransferase, partial [Oscillospiraceae bacterium]|nr:GNAT family N-acetyltransferase [Oscillospiraceae bacterium]